MACPPLRCFGVGVVLLSLAPGALSFSRGAGHASCREMIPGHIRAQPQDPKRGHVVLRAAASSYRPGQFVTVTVRSSRDFMGFLLQARGAPAAGSGGPSLGSWIFAPPGTHALRCPPEGDSLTHSDKQLKRNLSFVWRAPDAPMGDIRFYITVVQSYFVYWAGIKSAVLRDGSRSPWTGRNTTGVEGGNLARQEEDVAALPVSEGNHLTNQAVNERRTSSNIVGFIQTEAKSSENDNYTTLGSVSGVTEEAGTETGSPEDTKSYLQSTNPVPPMAGEVEATTNLLPNITGPLFLPYSLTSLPSLEDALRFLPIKPKSSLPPPEKSPTGPKPGSRQTSPPQLQTAVPLSSPPPPLSSSSYPQKDQSKSVQPAEALSISTIPWSKPHSQTAAPQTHTFVWKQPSPTRRSIEGKEDKDLPSKATLKTLGPISASISSTTPLSLSVSTPFSSTHTLLASSLVYLTTPLHPPGGPALKSVRTSSTHGALSSSTSTKNQPTTAPSLSALPSPSPISIPPHLPLVDPSSTSPSASSLISSTIPPSNPSSYPPLAPLISTVPLSTTSLSPFTASQSITGSTVSSPSFPTISSSSSASPTSSNSSSSLPSSSSLSTSTSTSFSSNLSAASSSTSPHPEPSPAPRRSLYHPLTSSTSSPAPSQQLTISKRLPIQNRIALSNPQPNLNLPTPRTVVLPNSKRHPNPDPNFDLNLGRELKPNLPKTDTKPKLLPDAPATPDKEGKYPDVIPRHSAWELGMLLGCWAGLGMALVVGLRYMCRQACGKQTAVTLNDREVEYGRGERGMLHVQECGDLVRVRRIRENSFVLLAEYDVLASPGD
ncbi:uncharacterized protein [Clinocottus analis]|uniref:uncharacterized protein n=1 Tax=Clinocottus analis TaxID=304258 RepID=UPI0035C26128